MDGCVAAYREHLLLITLTFSLAYSATKSYHDEKL